MGRSVASVKKAVEEQLDEQREDITATAGGAAIAGIGDLTNSVLRYVTNVVMTHMVASNIYGIFGELSTAMIILGWIAKVGLDGVMLRLVPTYRVQGRHDLVAGLVRFSIGVSLLCSLAFGVLIFVYAGGIAQWVYHDASYRLYLQEIAVLVPLFALQLVLSAGLQAFKEVKWKVYVDRFSQPLLTFITLFIFYLAGKRNEAPTLSLLAGYLSSVLIGQVVLRRVLRRSPSAHMPAYTPRVWIACALPMFFNGLIYGILNSADILFLSIFATPVQAGIYIAADRVSSFVTMPLFALNIIFSPMIAEYYADGRQRQLETLLKRVTRWSFSLSLPIFLICLVFHTPILEVFGPHYRAGGLALILLCCGNILNCATGPVLQLLAMTGRLRLLTFNSVITIGANIALSFVLVPRFTVLGAALVAASSVVILNGLSLLEVFWLMHIHPYRKDIWKPVLSGAIASLVAFLLLHIIRFASGWWGLVGRLSLILPFLLISVLLMIVLRIDKEDHIVFDTIYLRFRKKRLVQEEMCGDPPRSDQETASPDPPF